MNPKFCSCMRKSLLAALLLAIFFGPIGVLYNTVIGAFILLVFFLISLGTRSIYAIILIWLIGCFVTTVLTNRYNKKLFERYGA